MHRALIVKELREAAGLVVLAVLAMALVLAMLTGFPILPWYSTRIIHYPFLQDSLRFNFWLVAGGLAATLGLKQSAWELGKGTYHYLLHRPLSRHHIFGIKLAVGGGLVMGLSGLLLALYACWALTPGHFPAPFEWSMTWPAWRLWLALPVVYLGAFLSGVRPGRWFGSRLLPLAAAIPLTMLVSLAPWCWLSAITSLLVMVPGISAIFYYAQQRDY